jgi:predicted RNA methylase
MATSSILASLNVSSILDHGTGTFSFVCTASFVNASSASCVGGAIREASWADGGIDCRQSSASNVFLKTVENDTDHDASNASAIGIGDLA